MGTPGTPDETPDEGLRGDLVTVVIPLYNGATHIIETLDSVHAQTHPHVEVIVIDDGSTDGGPAIVKAHPVHARLVQQEHRGVAVARNRGLIEATGTWVAFLDQDDLWHPTRLARILAWLDDHPEERIVATSEVAFSMLEEVAALKAGDPLVGGWASHHVPSDAAYPTLLREVDVAGSERVEHHDQRSLIRGPIITTTSFVADPALIRLAGGFPPHARAMDDYWLLTNVANLQPIAMVDQPTSFYRVHLNATSRETRLALPFLSAAVALRLGEGLVPRDEGLRHPAPGPLHRHLLRELLRSAEYRDRDVRRAARHLSGLLFPGGHRRELLKAEVIRSAPWARPTVRRFRRLVRRMRGHQ